MKIYIALCCDRHIDEKVKVFTKPELAIEYVKEFIGEDCDITEQELTKEMELVGWIYLANYGVEGDYVRVEEAYLDRSNNNSQAE